MTASSTATKTGYNRFLLLVAGLGGLLYGVDVGIIAGALPSTLSEELPPSVIAPLNVMLPPEPPVE